jgi:hypothetical protein
MIKLIAVAAALLLVAAPAWAVGPTLGPRHDLTVFDKPHEAHVSAPAVAVTRDGKVIVAWIAQQGHDNNLFVAQPGGASKPVRVNPDGLFVESLHQPPGLALGPGDEVYVSWSSPKPVPEGAFFASDLRLSRSLDGGKTFESPLRVNEDRPISHSFEGLGVTSDGTVLVSWIDSRDGGNSAATYLARIVERGSRVERAFKLEDGETCVCCRVDVASGPRDVVAVTWRKVFPGSIRDMVVGLSRDGGRSFQRAGLVHADRWKINACPHRGGSIAMDDRGRVYVAWYTETADGQPRMLFAAGGDGGRFGSPVRLNTAAGYIPDQVRLASDPSGRVAIVWEEATAVRRRVMLRYSIDGGRTLSAPQALSQALKAYGPDVAVGPSGEFVVAWHEEQFPALKTVTQAIKLPK